MRENSDAQKKILVQQAGGIAARERAQDLDTERERDGRGCLLSASTITGSFLTVAGARRIIEAWRHAYNIGRPIGPRATRHPRSSNR